MEKELNKTDVKNEIPEWFVKPEKPESNKCECGIKIEPIYTEPYFFNGKNYYGGKWFVDGMCQKCKDKIDRDRIETERQQEYSMRIRNSGLYPKQLKTTFDDKSNSKMAEICRKFCIEPSYNMFIWGTSGIGKTHLLSCMANELLKTRKVVFYRMIDFLKTIKGKMFESSTEADDFIEALIKGKDILLFDDMGVEKPTETVKEKIYNLIDMAILQERTGLVFTSNLNLKSLAERLGDDRIASRIEELCKIYEFIGENKRTRLNKEYKEIKQ